MKKVLKGMALVVMLAASAVTLSTCSKGPLTEAKLKKRNINPLGDEELKALIMGKTLVIKNLPAKKLYEATYYDDGQRVLKHMTEKQFEGAAVYAFHGGLVPEGVAPYEIREGEVITTFGGKSFTARIYKVEGKYLAARSGEGGALNWELVESKPVEPKGEELTESALGKKGIKPLNNKGLSDLIRGKTLVVRNRATGEFFEATYMVDGKRRIRNITEERLRQGAYQAFHGGSMPSNIAPYEIRNGQIITTFDGKTFTVRVYNVEGKYLAARSGEGSAVNWEVVGKK